MRHKGRKIAGCLLGAAAVLVTGVLLVRSGRQSEAACAYARMMLDEAGDRFVILNGVADEQMVREEARRNHEAGRMEKSSRLLQFHTDAAFRSQLVARVRREWPTETNLWAAAQISPAAFADEVFRAYPDRVYTMTGKSTTVEKWSARWAMMMPYLGSRDRVVPSIRRAFALEGVTLANRLQGEGKLKDAWRIYFRVCNEVDPGNRIALVNLDGMLRRGYAADAGSRRRVECAMKELKQEGPVSESRSEVDLLAAWNNEMIRAHGRGDLAQAACIARKILSNPVWRTFIPANAVMGSVLAHEGDYVTAEMFFKAALSGQGTAAPQPVVMNDYADTLRRLKRYAEAEAFARRAVAESGGKVRLYKLTLDQILNEAKTRKGNAKEKKT